MLTTPAKRKLAPSELLSRRVRPRVEEEDAADDSSDSAPDADITTDSDGDDDDDDASESETSSDPGWGEEEGEGGDEEEEEDGGEARDPLDASTISFGALARAQESLTKPAPPPQPGFSRRESKPAAAARPHPPTKARPPPPPRKKPDRTVKGAPLEQSSKRPVRRTLARLTGKLSSGSAAPGSGRRDPRFDPAIASSAAAPLSSTADPGAAEARARRAYAFLDQYRADELRALRAQLGDKKAPPEVRDRARREIGRIESRQRTRDRRDLRRRVEEEHRARERELAKKGKRPYFLKRAEMKKRVLTEAFAHMSEGQVDKAIEKRRKKAAAKERMELDQLERRARAR